jgi:hypothetical protein
MRVQCNAVRCDASPPCATSVPDTLPAAACAWEKNFSAPATQWRALVRRGGGGQGGRAKSEESVGGAACVWPVACGCVVCWGACVCERGPSFCVCVCVCMSFRGVVWASLARWSSCSCSSRVILRKGAAVDRRAHTHTHTHAHAHAAAPPLRPQKSSRPIENRSRRPSTKHNRSIERGPIQKHKHQPQPPTENQKMGDDGGQRFSPHTTTLGSRPTTAWF